MSRLYNILGNIATDFSELQKKTARANIGATANLFTSSSSALQIHDFDGNTGKIGVSIAASHLDTYSNGGLYFSLPSDGKYCISHAVADAIAADKPYIVGRNISGHVIYTDDMTTISASDIGAAAAKHSHGYLMSDGRLSGNINDFGDSSGYITPSDSTNICLVEAGSYILQKSSITFSSDEDAKAYYLTPRGKWMKAYSLAPDSVLTGTSTGYVSVSFAGSWLQIDNDGIGCTYTHNPYGTETAARPYAVMVQAYNRPSISGTTEYEYGHVFDATVGTITSQLTNLGLKTTNTTYKFETGATQGTITVTPITNTVSGSTSGTKQTLTAALLKSCAYKYKGSTKGHLAVINSDNELQSGGYPVGMYTDGDTLATFDSKYGTLASFYISYNHDAAAYIDPFAEDEDTGSYILNIDNKYFTFNDDGALALAEDKLVLIDDTVASVYPFYIKAGDKYPMAYGCTKYDQSRAKYDYVNKTTTIKSLFTGTAYSLFTPKYTGVYEVDVLIPQMHVTHATTSVADATSYVMSFAVSSQANGVYIHTGYLYSTSRYSDVSNFRDPVAKEEFNTSVHCRFLMDTTAGKTASIYGYMLSSGHRGAESAAAGTTDFLEVIDEYIPNYTTDTVCIYCRCIANQPGSTR